MTFEATPLNLLLLALVAAGVWAIVELALTIRKARTTLGELSATANETVGQVQPIIGKVDGLMDDIQPSIKEVQPLVEKVGVTLTEVNDILGDVSSVSGTASSVTASVKSAAGSAAEGVAAAVGRLVRRDASDKGALEAPEPVEPEVIPPAPADDGYVTYGPAAQDPSQPDAE